MPSRPGRLALPLACLLALIAAPARADFQLSDGDTVVFLGDSITAEKTYGKVVENYTLLRFPDRKIRFINAGHGGDTAERCLKRLDRDVLDAGATVVIFALGINDIGWGTKADDEHRKLYLDSTRAIVERCKARGVRIYVCSAAITNETSDHGDTDYLQKMCDDGMAIARELGEPTIDIQRSMRTIHRSVRAARARSPEKEEKDRPTMHAADGVHLSELGGTAMGFAVLKGLGAPADVSAATIDAADPTRSEGSNCRITDAESRDGRVTFGRLDAGLPLNLGFLAGLRFHFIPIGDELNGYTLAVRNLPAGKYDVAVDGTTIGAWPADQLARGVNIASATTNGLEPGGPWEAEAWILRQLTESRNEIIDAGRNLPRYLPDRPDVAALRAQFDATARRLEDDQRALVRPRPFRFVVSSHVEQPKQP